MSIVSCQRGCPELLLDDRSPVIRVTGQNGIGQNVTDKMVTISIDFNSIEYIFSKHELQISDKPKLV